MKTAEHSHPQHRFVPIYGSISEPSYEQEVHYGIYCDGPLCRNKSSATYITGVRYKCAICHDTDFCGACEALPTATHNRTHPLIKLRTPVRNVSVSTMGGDGLGGQSILMGDHTAPVLPTYANAQSSNNSSTVVEAPSVVEKEETEEVQEEAHEDVKENASQTDEAPTTPVIETAPKSSNADADLASDYNAYFMRDTISDGTNMAPSHVFEQTWTLYNPGPSTWPVGTSVRFVGGDAMFNVNTEHPSSTVALAEAMSSNELTHPVAPSESADFSVTLKSTQRVGTSISYWRLKLPNGSPYGHKLWCDIKVVDQPTESETTLAGSNMVFPKLEKESPVSSIHQAVSQPSTPAFTAPVSNADEQGIFEDVESLTLEEVESDDDGFFTDEEYDILDASDQESFSEKHI
jgi:next to BRCA1 gene 1 protein